MTKPTVEMNRSTVHARSPMQSCRDRDRQSFIFHAKRQLGQFAWSTLQHEFDRANATEDTRSPVEPLDRHPAFAGCSALDWRPAVNGDDLTLNTLDCSLSVRSNWD